MAPAEAAKVLLTKLSDPQKPHTVADASAESGLALRDAEGGLTHLTSEYRGHLRVTEDGDLLYVFPDGFSKPWETRERFQIALSKVGHVLAGAGRFVVRAWLLIAMVTYALVFVALIIAQESAKRGGDSRSGGGGLGLLGGLLRMIAEAAFWTFRPFSAFYVMGPYLAEEQFQNARAFGGRRQKDPIPFYERVNRFVFGPQQPPEDPLEVRARILAEIRAKKGRIGLFDVMRVTGLPRAEADPLMARLMLDQEGEVEVSNDGGIFYVFPAMRRTALESEEGASNPLSKFTKETRAAWDSPKVVPPLTGNSAGQNFGIAALNAFNLAASTWVLAHGLTISNFILSISKKPPHILPDDGLPIVLGVIPFVFSVALFLLPLARTITRKFAVDRAAKENARLGILREVLAHAPKKEPVTDESLRRIVRVATGSEPTSKDITREVVALGGDVDTGPEGEVRYRFADLERESEALEEEREHADEKEARVGRVVFASDKS